MLTIIIRMAEVAVVGPALRKGPLRPSPLPRSSPHVKTRSRASAPTCDRAHDGTTFRALWTRRIIIMTILRISSVAFEKCADICILTCICMERYMSPKRASSTSTRKSASEAAHVRRRRQLRIMIVLYMCAMCAFRLEAPLPATETAVKVGQSSEIDETLRPEVDPRP